MKHLAVVFLLAVGLAACGGGDSPTTPIAPANLVSTGLSMTSQCDALRSLNYAMGGTTATCTSFNGTMQNNGSGCAGNIRGTTITYFTGGAQVGSASWTYSYTVRPGETFSFTGGQLTVPVSGFQYTTTATWDDVRCQ